MEEQRISFNELIHPDMEAIAKRDTFLSDENGERLNNISKVFWPDIDEEPKLDTVIKEWEAVLSHDPLDAPWDLIDETLELLKKQKPVAPKKTITSNGFHYDYCGDCGTLLPVDEKYKKAYFCPNCGRGVMWG